MVRAHDADAGNLRDVPEAAWLWMGWGAGPHRLGQPRGASLISAANRFFDLVDRPFDFLEPGVEMIAGLARNLRRGQVESALLHFPSAGASGPHRLPLHDPRLGRCRPGVLVVARQPASAEAQKTADDIMAAFESVALGRPSDRARRQRPPSECRCSAAPRCWPAGQPLGARGRRGAGRGPARPCSRRLERSSSRGSSPCAWASATSA